MEFHGVELIFSVCLRDLRASMVIFIKAKRYRECKLYRKPHKSTCHYF